VKTTELMPKNSFELARQMRSQSKAVSAFDSVDDVSAMARYFYDRGRLRDACMFILQVNTGLRIGDILDFTWDECLWIDPSDGCVHPVGETCKIENKTRKGRDVIFNRATAAAVYLHWLNSGRPPLHQYMFVSARKQGAEPHLTVRSASRIMTGAAKDAGLWSERRKISTHSARKTAMSVMAGVTKGAELDDATIRRLQGIKLAQLMGNHSKSTTTNQHYVDWEWQILRDRIGALNLGWDAIREYCVTTQSPVTTELRRAITEG